MVRIRWIITDDIKNVDFYEFSSEWNGIFGYFEIRVNNRVVGFYPDRELFPNEDGNEDISYWLNKLLDGIMQLDMRKEYEIQLLSMNLLKLVFNKRNVLVISLVNTQTNDMIWSERIPYEEMYDEIRKNIRSFIREINNLNPALLEAGLIKELTQI